MNGTASIGECMLELSGTGTGDWKLNHAGDTFNVNWALRALLPADKPTDYVSAFGDDPFSTQQLDFFAASNIGTAASPRIPGARPGLYAITLTGAERSFTYWRGDSAARCLADDLDLLNKSLQNKELIYFSGITLAILEDPARANLFEAIRTARKAGSLIAFDPNYRPRLWTSEEQAQRAIAEAVRLSDIALPTFPDEQALFGDENPEATAERLAALGLKEIVVKNGEEPALVIADGRKELIPALHVASPIDTTGAGDSFNGGYLAARILGKTPFEAALCGHRVAATVVQVRGALAPFEALQKAFAG